MKATEILAFGAVGIAAYYLFFKDKYYNPDLKVGSEASNILDIVVNQAKKQDEQNTNIGLEASNILDTAVYQKYLQMIPSFNYPYLQRDWIAEYGNLTNAGSQPAEAYVQAWQNVAQSQVNAGLDIFGTLKSSDPGFVPPTLDIDVPTNLTQPDGSSDTTSIDWSQGVGSVASSILDTIVSAANQSPTESPSADTVPSMGTGTISGTLLDWVSAYNSEVKVQYDRQMAAYGFANDYQRDAYSVLISRGYTAPSDWSW